MPIEFHSSFNNVKDYLGSNILANSLFGSTLWVSVIIVFIICVLSITFMGGSSTSVKFVAYTGLSVLAIMFIHDSVLYSSIKKDSYKTATANLMQQIEQSKRDESIRVINNYVDIPKSTMLQKSPEIMGSANTTSFSPPSSIASSNNHPLTGGYNTDMSQLNRKDLESKLNTMLKS